jgi:clan AA aspartic protease
VGTFRAEFSIGDLSSGRWEPVEAVVDTGSSYSWIPRDLLEKLGVTPQFQWEFELADGSTIERDLAEAPARWDGQQRTTLVVFGDTGSTPILGAYTLEGFGLTVDPVNGRLNRIRGLAMSAGFQP